MGAPKGNKFALGNNGGRPRKYETPEEMETVLTEYFQECTDNDEWPLVTGLTLYLGFAGRKSLYEYINKYKEFSNLLKRALTTVELAYESKLSTTTPTGAIFALKNMGWRDKQELEHSGNVKVDLLELMEATRDE